MVDLLRNSVGGVARDADEDHRAATPLELFFDLCFVVAVSQAAAELHHAFGIVASLNVALVGTAVVLVAFTIAHGAALRRRVGQAGAAR